MSYGKKAIGEYVYDSVGNRAKVIDMYVLNGKKCMVRLQYDDGIIQAREKFFVKLKKFIKPGSFDIDAALSSGNWKHLYGYEKYYIISKNGELVRIEGKNKGRIKSACSHSGGYKTYHVYTKGKLSRKNIFVHRLVIETFVRKINEGEEVNHIDGNKTNNKLCNLEIVTRLQNNCKYLDLGSLGINRNHQEKIENYCMQNNITTKQFIANCIKEVMPDASLAC
jgi:hypothetical protein